MDPSATTLSAYVAVLLGMGEVSHRLGRRIVAIEMAKALRTQNALSAKSPGAETVGFVPVEKLCRYLRLKLAVVGTRLGARDLSELVDEIIRLDVARLGASPRGASEKNRFASEEVDGVPCVRAINGHTYPIALAKCMIPVPSAAVLDELAGQHVPENKREPASHYTSHQAAKSVGATGLQPGYKVTGGKESKRCRTVHLTIMQG